MGRPKISTIAPLAFLLFLAVARSASAQTPRPLCASQYALANYACSMIPYSPLPPPSYSTPSSEDDDDDDEDDEEHRHHRRRQSPRREEHGGTPEQEDCCRWLSEMDNDCVCGMLLRLPEFLSKPVHEYSVYVGSVCNVTYTCSGRVIRK